MPATVTLFSPLALWMPSVSMIVAVTTVFALVKVPTPAILNPLSDTGTLLPFSSVTVNVEPFLWISNLTVLSFVVPSSCGSVILTSILSPSTAFLGILIVTVVLYSSLSLSDFSLLIDFEPFASSKLTTGAFTCSKLAFASASH